VGGLEALVLLLEALDQGFEVAAVDKLHHQEVGGVGDADIEDLDDVGVL
jgi:hypothetical protein